MTKQKKKTSLGIVCIENFSYPEKNHQRKIKIRKKDRIEKKQKYKGNYLYGEKWTASNTNQNFLEKEKKMHWKSTITHHRKGTEKQTKI